MSLIPTESYSFPDDFSRAISRARALHEIKQLAEAAKKKGAVNRGNRIAEPDATPVAPPPASAREKPVSPRSAPPVSPRQPPVAVVRPAPLDPPTAPPPPPVTTDRIAVSAAPIEPSAASQSAPPPSPAVNRPPSTSPSAPAPQARAPIPRKVPFHKTPLPPVALKGNTRPPGAKPMGPVRLPKSVRIPADVMANASAAMPPVANPPAIANSAIPPISPAAAQEEELRAVPSAVSIQVRSRRRKKLLRFAMAESFALAVLLPCVWIAFSHYVQQQFVLTTINIVTLIAAAVAAILPIVFFAVPSKLPRD